MRKYYLLLFFVAVKTNDNYQVVASFLLQDESAAMKKALSVINAWNPTWKPKCFMDDNCDEEINLISNICPRT